MKEKFKESIKTIFYILVVFILYPIILPCFFFWLIYIFCYLIYISIYGLPIVNKFNYIDEIILSLELKDKIKLFENNLEMFEIKHSNSISYPQRDYLNNELKDFFDKYEEIKPKAYWTIEEDEWEISRDKLQEKIFTGYLAIGKYGSGLDNIIMDIDKNLIFYEEEGIDDKSPLLMVFLIF